MFSSLRLLTLSPGASGSVREETLGRLAEAADAAGAASTLFAPTCPGVWNGGDLIWRSEYRDEAAYRAAEGGERFRRGAASLLADPARVRGVEHVAFAGGADGGVSPERGLYRVALFCANRRPTAERIARFERETAAMPRHVHSIRRWQLSSPLHASGTRPWTHVWEQEYDDLAGLAGPYMLHPCHWGHVDRWFDPEDPEWLVDPQLCHAFCETSAAVIGAGDPSRRS
jgi:hypothetical protein